MVREEYTLLNDINPYFVLIAESMPTDLVAMSFWCGKNVQLPYADRIAAFTTNSVTNRLLIIGKAIVHVSIVFFTQHL